LIRRLKSLQWPRARVLHKAAAAITAVAVIAFALQLARQNRRYLREVRNPELASFEELKWVLRSVVPEGVCSVAIKAPVFWLAFPEHDRCFATIEKRMMENLDIDGKDYAVLMPAAYHKNRLPETMALDAKYHLLAELKDTAYGAIRVYYTGSNQDYLALAPKTYYFFDQHRGHVSQSQVEKARSVWSVEPGDADNQPIESGLLIDSGGISIQPAQEGRRAKSVDLWPVDLKPDAIYQLSLDAIASAGKWELAVIDQQTGAIVHRERFGDQVDLQRVEGLFKTSASGRVKLVVQPLARNMSEPLRISRISISEIPSG
jgi:hypothetical protein